MTDAVPRVRTQGQEKESLRLKRLFTENEIFKSELDEILEMPNKTKQNKALWKLAYKYRLEYEMGSPLLNYIMKKKKILDWDLSNNEDVCMISDEEDHYLNECFRVDFDYPPSRLPMKRAQIKAFPIHIGINIYATKRDVLDFVNKRWDEIRYMLDCFTADRPSVTRKRVKAERDELIWENRGLPARDLADLVNAKFPEENLTYSDINSILYYLKQRKFSSLV